MDSDDGWVATVAISSSAERLYQCCMLRRRSAYLDGWWMLVAIVGRRLRSMTEVVFTAEVGNGDAPGLRLFTKPFSTNVTLLRGKAVTQRRDSTLGGLDSDNISCQMPFLSPNQQSQSTERIKHKKYNTQ